MTSTEILFEMFSSALADPDTADRACRYLLVKFLGPDVVVQWSDLQALDPVQTLLQAVSEGRGLSGTLGLPACTLELGSRECTAWWHALLARHSLYGEGDAIGAEEFGELMVSAFRILRDCHAPDPFLRNLRTVRLGAPRLKERYVGFEFVSRGSLGKTYKCRSRLTREERSCRQVRKDWIIAPSDQVRSEIALLRNIDHPHLPSVVETFEDYNSVYVIVDLVEGLELMQFLNQQLTEEKCLSEMWVAEVLQQVLEALQYCHELRPHSIVHGDLRLDSLVLAPISDAALAPHVVVVDLGLAGLLPPPPQHSQSHAAKQGAFAQPACSGRDCGGVSPKRDVWSCGCLLFLLLTGRHPLGRDVGGPLLPAPDPPPGSPEQASPDTARREPDWELLQQTYKKASWLSSTQLGWEMASSDVLPLCRRMLERDPWKRAGTGECLDHPWLVAATAGHPQEKRMPLEALRSLVQLHACWKKRQVVTNNVVTELGPSVFAAIAASFALLDNSEGAGGADDRAEASDGLAAPSVPEPLARMKLSEYGRRKVLREFGCDADGPVDYGNFFAGCLDLAEDRLDHALWRIFTASGEDHRGIITFAGLERALAEGHGSADILVGLEVFCASLTSPNGDAIAKQNACNGIVGVSFEELKEFVMNQRCPAAAECSPDSDAQVDLREADFGDGSELIATEHARALMTNDCEAEARTASPVSVVTPGVGESWRTVAPTAEVMVTMPEAG